MKQTYQKQIGPSLGYSYISIYCTESGNIKCQGWSYRWYVQL